MDKSMDRSFLIGDKIYLRPLDMDDLEGEYIQWVNDERICKHMGTLHFSTTKRRLQEYLESQLNNKNIAFFAIIEKETGKHIGNVKLGPIDWINRRAEYGRMIGDKSAQGKGHGTEVVDLILKYAFNILNLHKITTSASISNEASIKSSKKVGLRVEGTLKEHEYENGQYKDAYVMGITKDEYFKKMFDK